ALLSNRGVRVRVCTVGRMPTPWSLLRLIHEVGKAGSPLVLTQAFRANLWGRLAAIVRGHTVIASVRATYRYLPSAYFPLERMLAQGTAAVVTPSHATTRFLAERVGVPARKIVTIPNGV